MFSDFLIDFPADWFDDIREFWGSSLTDDMIMQSVTEASEFFNMDEPFGVAESDTIGVYPLNPDTVNDDILVFSYDQFMEMGISEKAGLDLVFTHEMGHRALQGMNLGFNSHQEELCCDFLAGVRAGLNGLDVGQFENALADTMECDTHPGGADRVEAIEAGVEFGKAYFEEFGAAPKFSDCLEHFNDIEVSEMKGFMSHDQITLTPEDSFGHPSFGCTRK